MSIRAPTAERSLPREVLIELDRNAPRVYGATHTGSGGPVPATGKKCAADYVYVMQFDGDKIGHMTKIWHSGLTLKALGWA